MAQKVRRSQKTKKAIVVEILHSAILAGDLEPGERLTQEELASRFNVSVTPVREAIQQLVAEGVLDQSPYKGVQVAEVNLEEATEVYLIRSVIENLATRCAVPNLKISDVRRLHKLHDDLTHCVESGDLAPLRKLNYEFHMLLYETAAMPRLYRIIRNLWAQTPWDTLYVVPNRPTRLIEEHSRIMTAIDQGDGELAGKAMQAHIEGVLKMLAEYLAAQSSG